MSESAEIKASSDVNFRPVTVLFGIVWGTVFSICCSLIVVSFVFWLLEADYPRLQAEIPELLRATVMFVLLSIVGGFSFYGSLKSRSWRYYPMVLLWVGMIGTSYYYWPETY